MILAIMVALTVFQCGFGQKAIADCYQSVNELEDTAARFYDKAKEIDGAIDDKWTFAELQKLVKIAKAATGDKEVSPKELEQIWGAAKGAQMTAAIKAIEAKLKELKAIDAEVNDILKDIKRECR